MCLQLLEQPSMTADCIVFLRAVIKAIILQHQALREYSTDRPRLRQQQVSCSFR